SLVTANYPTRAGSDQEKRHFFWHILAALEKAFAGRPYTEFNCLLWKSHEKWEGEEALVHKLAGHQIDFLSALADSFSKEISGDPAKEDTAKFLNALRESAAKLVQAGRVRRDGEFDSHSVPLRFAYDPVAGFVSITTLRDLSYDAANYPNKLATTSELLLFIASVKRAAVFVADLSNTSFFRADYARAKLLDSLI